MHNDFGSVAQASATAQEIENEIKLMTAEVLNNFIPRALVKASPSNMKARCVDGRPGISDESFPVVSYPGAHGGDAMVLFSAVNSLGVADKFSPEALIEMVRSLSDDGKFHFHTDQKAVEEQQVCGWGCGHMKNAYLNPHDYGVTSDQMQALFNQCEYFEGCDKSNQVTLQGQHLETAVVVVESEHWGLKPYIEDAQQVFQAFVYHKTFHEQHLERLANCLADAISSEMDRLVVRSAIDTAYAIQLGQTLSRLAQGYPIYAVKVASNGEFTVNDFV